MRKAMPRIGVRCLLRRTREKEDDERMIYFTSDLHLNHARIIELANRPFGSVEEMNDTIIGNINDTVGADDTLWVLGDVCMGMTKTQDARKLLETLECKDVHLVMGNHDPRRRRDELIEAGFATVSDYEELRVGSHRAAVLCHYPLMSWNGSARGAYMLHGHIHATAEYNERNRRDGIRRYDVGVDANGYRPVSIEHVKEFFADVGCS